MAWPRPRCWCSGGCATFKEELVAPTGELANCQTTGGGLMGMAVAAVNSSNCTDTMRGRGYKPVAEAVTTGIILSKEEIPAKIVAVKDNSPADNVGLKSGDIILAIDGKDVTNRIDAGKFLSDGAAGSTLIIKVKRGEQELTMPVGRVPYLSLQAKM